MQGIENVCFRQTITALTNNVLTLCFTHSFTPTFLVDIFTFYT